MTSTIDEAFRFPEMAFDHVELGLTDEQAIEMFRLMVLARRIDDRMWALNRQGRAPFVVSASGHEAIQIASTFALDKTKDWLLPYYRDMGVALAWDVTPLDIFLAVFSKQADGTSAGRQLPNHWSDPSKNMFTHSSAIATQYPHAAGIAKTHQMDGSDAIAVVYGGEGSTSEGDWHETMNFAGVHKLPLIIVIEKQRVRHLGSVGPRGRRFDR